MRSSSPAAWIAAFIAVLAGACDDAPPSDPPAGDEIVVVGVVDPDLSEPTSPVPARLLWFSTRPGVARFSASYGELCDRVAVSGGELTTTSIDAVRMEPGLNDVEIRLVPQRAGQDIVERVQVFVDADCTWPDHCEGACVDFTCQ